MQSDPSKRALVEISEPIFEIGTALSGGFIRGELYLYHRSDRRCPSESSLWGVFDRTTDDSIRLESCSRDLSDFRFWLRLPAGYRYARRASRTELRDYTAGLAYYECCSHEPIVPHRYR